MLLTGFNLCLFNAECLMEGVFHQHMERIFDIRLLPNKLILTPHKYYSMYYNEMITSRYGNNTYPWMLPREGILYVFVSRDDSAYDFNLTFLERRILQTHSIVGITINENRLVQRLQVILHHLKVYQLLKYSPGCICCCYTPDQFSLYNLYSKI